ncbi:Protein of unknown function DUF4779 [Cinara cedri]|uniref:Uncharacterized protein n=1 Tax=Cinara cedri TaxID=506608 RepID=A0A5E4MF33_9HEMI|nr:Protein of unknown function DUF4779 [Cinara cedri]
MNFRIGLVIVTFAALVFSTMTAVYGARTAAMYVKERGQVQDLEASASGYIYRTDGQSPPVFIKLGEGNDEKFDAILENFKRENGFHGMPVGGGGHGIKQHASPYNIPVVGEDKVLYSDHLGGGVGGGSYGPSAHHFGGGMADDFEDGKHDLDDHLGPLVDDHDHEHDHDYDNGAGFDIGSSPYKYHHDVSPKGDTHGVDDQNYYGSPYTYNEHKSPGRHHSKEGGSFKKAGHYYSHGSKGDSGYKHHNDFDKGSMGKYGKDDMKAHYKKASGHKHAHENEGDHYGKHTSTEHGIKGNKFGEEASHKKGQKTTGFHNVYHKDEYNKDTKFYDDAHKHGKFNKYGGAHKDFTHKDGGHKHGTHHESGYDEGHKGIGGHHNKGGYHEGHKGHSGESGHKSHHDHKAEYDTMSDNKKYGEHDDIGHGGGGGYDFY